AFAKQFNTTPDDLDMHVIYDMGNRKLFVVYPQALAKLPFPNFWAVLFFFSLLCLALNSQFALVEVVVTSIQDGFPRWIKRYLVCHEIVVLVVCIVSFFFGLPYVTQVSDRVYCWVS
ncbi:sodium- and chloride-dependent GABA transporter ine-like, partial [Diaphorina citri]|uniref:Sodium- and chloride-dependent GABA transporter ine-like n=1 Tax=Diaphorina citri TaxID=121845 RepID=A0A1S4EKG5_DIACI